MAATIGSKIGQLTFLAQLLPTMQKSDNEFYLTNNICDLERSGFYSGIQMPFPQRGNYTYCTSIANSALTLGYSSAMNAYIQGAGATFGANTQTATYTTAQKQAYLNSNFFTSTALMTDYLELHVSWIKNELMKPITAIAWAYIFIWNSLCAIMLITVVLNVWLNGKWTLKRLRRDIKFVRCSYSLVSYKSLVNENKIRQQFLDCAGKFEVLE